MKNRILSLLAWCLPFFLLAQSNASTQSILAESENGIQWVSGLSWEQVKEKAKQENKYIFLDCFTTWCAPCKLMDKQVYNNEAVGKLFNEKFISVKVQMDKTKADNGEIKAWYNDVEKIGKDFLVEGYPTFLFLSPQGTLVNKDVGFKDANTFIGIANNALLPGTVFEDPAATYDRLVREYKEGKRDYDSYPFMIIMSWRKGPMELHNHLLKELTDYLATVEKDKRYTKERIEMWDQFTFGSNTQTFKWLYQDAKIIDAVAHNEYKRGNLIRLQFNKKGWAETMVDRTIQAEIVAPFFAEQNKNSKVSMSGMYLSGKSLPSDSSEADWKELKNRIEKKYGSDYAERNVRLAQMEWYTRHRNYEASVAAALQYFKKDFSVLHINPYTFNNYAWEAFIRSNDKKILNEYIKLMKKVITNRMKDDHALLDTYANLLYKVGRKKKALKIEELAVNFSGGKESEHVETLEKMKKGLPTWPTRK